MCSKPLILLHRRGFATSVFTVRDPFEGFPEQPYSLHPYQYAYADPVLWRDPSGRCSAKAGDSLEKCAADLLQYDLQITQLPQWQVYQLELVESAVMDFIKTTKWSVPNFRNAIDPTKSHPLLIEHSSEWSKRVSGVDAAAVTAPQKWPPSENGTVITFYESTFKESVSKNKTDETIKWEIVHELAHAWDNAYDLVISHNFAAAIGSCENVGFWGNQTYYTPGNIVPSEMQNTESIYKYKGRLVWSHGYLNEKEDWATTIAAIVYPDFHLHKGFFYYRGTDGQIHQAVQRRWTESLEGESRVQ